MTDKLLLLPVILVGALVFLAIFSALRNSGTGRSEPRCGNGTERQPSSESNSHRESTLSTPPLYSHTRLATFTKCPAAYSFKYIEHRDKAFGTIETFLGRSVHSALEWGYEQQLTGNTYPSTSAVASAFDGMWSKGSRNEMKVVKQNKYGDDYRRLGHKMLSDFWDRVLSEDSLETIALEHKLQITLPSGQRYIGILDRIARDVNGRLHVIDFKTGNPKYLKHPRDERQLLAYGMLALGEFDDDKVVLVIEDLQGQRTLSHVFHRSDVPTITERIDSSIDTLLHMHKFRTKPSILCGWCGFRPYCRDGKEHWKQMTFRYAR